MADEVGQANALSILGAHKEQYKSVQVNKDIGVHYDSGNLMVSDVNLLDSDALKYVALQHPAIKYPAIVHVALSLRAFNQRRDTDSYLKELTRDNTQLLIREIWKVSLAQV